ncbi:MAG: hypothetical protein QNJ18_04045 [Xenococcaceae cyanobacterium MO_167.B52]|nr:hypothetical protein [Xenococcaceae cyanobacterium MO_167.B52]
MEFWTKNQNLLFLAFDFISSTTANALVALAAIANNHLEGLSVRVLIVA